jgi:cytochrome c oxidase cbb3-type subunit 3
MRGLTALLTACLLAACRPADVLSPAAMAEPGNAPAARAASGRDIYNYRCYFCHGYSGDARTLAATYLSPPPADFTRLAPGALSRESVIATLHQGKAGTAMRPFSGILNEAEMAAVADFVLDEFVARKAPNTRYHTAENGWPEHQRYRVAFPFAIGEIPLTRAWSELTPEEARGKRLFLSSCVSCHDRGRREEDDVAWDARPLSFPRNHYDHANPPRPDAVTGASPYLLHDRPLKITGLSARERNGEKLFLENCAFCHAADGTGRNWIGQFLEPHPRDLTSPDFMRGQTKARLIQAIGEGLPGTSMPAWKSVLDRRQIEDIVAYVGKAFHPLPE